METDLRAIDVTTLRCSLEGCKRDWHSPGGLANVGNNGGEKIWRCYEHRDLSDYASHRNDLRDSIDRHVKLAVRKEQEKILNMFNSTEISLLGIHEYLQKQLEPPSPAETSDEGFKSDG